MGGRSREHRVQAVGIEHRVQPTVERVQGRHTDPAASAFSLSLEGERRESPTAAPDHGIVLRVRVRW